MKKIINVKIVLSFLLLVFITSCTKDFDTLNSDSKSTNLVSPNYLIAGAQKRMMDQFFMYDVNSNTTVVQTQYFSQNAYNNESRYVFRDGSGDAWELEFYQSLKNLKIASDQIHSQPVGRYSADEVRAYDLVITVLRVFAFQNLTDRCGPIVYSESMDEANTKPNYDSQEVVYKGLLKELDDAVIMAKNGLDFGEIGSDDKIYEGDSEKWVKFANSMMLRLAMRISHIDKATATTYVAKAIDPANGGLISSNDDNALFIYLTGSNGNPYWTDVYATRVEIVASNTIMDMQKSLSDPRLSVYWRKSPNVGAYVSLQFGKPGAYNYKNYSSTNRNILGAFQTTGRSDLPGMFFDYAEVEFFLAEAVLEGIITTGSAVDHYNNGIYASIEYWLGQVDRGDETQDLYDAYIAQAGVDLDQAVTKADKIARIGEQKWLALFLQGPEAYSEQRRLDSPALTIPEGLTASNYPVRNVFSLKEYAINNANVKNAVTLLNGPDKETTKLWWDVK